MVSIDTIKKMRQECACQDIEYCPLQELAIHFNSSDRLFTQHKCVEKFKMIESKKAKRELDWKQAYMQWVSDGYAKIFAEIYNDGIKLPELYKKLFKI
jgi:hypothetical protein